MKSTAIVCCAGAMLLGAAATTSANLIQNGSFESGAFSPGGDNGMALSNGSTAIDYWGVTNDIAWGRTVAWSEFSASEGEKFLDLTGYAGNLGAGVTQSIATTAGQWYTLSFDLGPNMGSTVQVQATAGGTSADLSATGQVNEWRSVSMDFQATANTTPISILGVTAGFNFIGLDNVAVEAKAPEPASTILLGTGLLGLAGRALRQRTRAARR